jgi:hypothetical protein
VAEGRGLLGWAGITEPDPFVAHMIEQLTTPLGEPSPWAAGGEPVAVVDQVGPRSWRIVIRYTEQPTMDGVRPIEREEGQDGWGWTSWGSRERADRKAARILRRFIRRAQYPREEHTIHG